MLHFLKVSYQHADCQEYKQGCWNRYRMYGIGHTTFQQKKKKRGNEERDWKGWKSNSFVFIVPLIVQIIISFLNFEKALASGGPSKARCSLKVHWGITPRSHISRPDWAGPGWLVSGAGSGILQAKSGNKVYSMFKYQFMNKNGCQIYFIL